MRISTACVLALAAATGLAGTLGGCSSKPKRLDAGQVRAAIPEIQREGTPRETILRSLGEPTSSFENGRLVTYRLQHAEKGDKIQPVWPTGEEQTPIASWHDVDYSLVLIFDESDRLEDVSIIPTR